MRGIHWWPVKMFPFGEVIMIFQKFNTIMIITVHCWWHGDSFMWIVHFMCQANPGHYLWIKLISGRNEIWDALVLRTSSRAFALVRTRVLLVRKKVQILVYNSPARPKAILRKEERWLTDVGHNSWRHMKSAQHAAHNPNFEKLGLFRHARWWRLKDKRTHIPGWW